MFLNYSKFSNEELEALKRDQLAVCDSTGKYFNIGLVEVVARYADCSVFKCPACNGVHDDRVSFYGRDRNSRNGFTMVRSL